MEDKEKFRIGLGVIFLVIGAGLFLQVLYVPSDYQKMREQGYTYAEANDYAGGTGWGFMLMGVSVAGLGLLLIDHRFAEMFFLASAIYFVYNRIKPSNN